MNLKICEMFGSIQGESSFAGFPFFFIRLTGCNLRCSYCDTKYAYDEGRSVEIQSIVEQVKNSWMKNILITGGEPLCQKNIYILMEKLLNLNKKVFIETNGSILTDKVQNGVVKIVDFKTPSSNMHEKNNFENVKYLNKNDEVKFVIGNDEDFNWSCSVIRRYNLLAKVKNVLFSPNESTLSAEELSELILNERINVRLQIQLHKYIKQK